MMTTITKLAMKKVDAHPDVEILETGLREAIADSRAMPSIKLMEGVAAHNEVIRDSWADLERMKTDRTVKLDEAAKKAEETHQRVNENIQKLEAKIRECELVGEREAKKYDDTVIRLKARYDQEISSAQKLIEASKSALEQLES